MLKSKVFRAALLACLMTIPASSTYAQEQVEGYPKPSELPNPYRLESNWGTLPPEMNGGNWGEVIRVSIAPDGNVWVLHRCFNTEPPGHATCINRGPENPPILEFSPDGKLLRGLGAGLLAYPHGFTVDPDGNLWASDVNNEDTVLGMPAKSPEGVRLGQQAFKLSPEGKVLMTLGKPGVGGPGNDTFDRPTGVAVAPNGDIFVSDGHFRNASNNARILKFSKDGTFIKSWGRLGSEPGNFNEPHDIYVGGSLGRVYIADRQNRRIQVFDQDGNFIAAWYQFGQPSSVFISDDDTIYVGASYRDPGAKMSKLARERIGERRGIVVGNAIDGSLKAFIPDPTDLANVELGTSASGIAADAEGNIYAADVGAHQVRKYLKIK